MRRIRQFLNQLLREDDGPTAIEYAVMLSLILLVCIGAVNSVGRAVSKSLQTTADEISATAGGTGSGSSAPGNGKGNNGNGKGNGGSNGSGS